MPVPGRDNGNLDEVILAVNLKHRSFRAALGTTVGVAGLVVAVSTGAWADDGGDSRQSPTESRPVPEAPTVRERMEHGQIITEYERRGGVYLMTVKPRVGPTQYWNDPDGDGQFQRSTSDDIDENVNLPKWRLGGW